MNPADPIGGTPRPHPPSFWAASAPLAPLRPPLRGEVTADVVVIGAGYTGLSAALALAKAGRTVVVLDANRVGWGASGRNGGLMIPGQRNDAETLIARYGVGRAKALWDLALAGRELLIRLVREHDIDCDLTVNGYVHAALTPAAADACKREADRLVGLFDYGAVTALDAKGIAAHVRSDRYVGGMHDARGGHLHPLKLALGLAKAAEAAGANIHEGSPVVEVQEGARAIVRTAQGSVSAAHAIIANDAFAGTVDARLGSLTMPVGNCLIATEPLGNWLTNLLPTGASVSDTKFVLDYFRPTADGRLVFGGGERYTPGEPADIAGFVRPYVSRVFPSLKTVRFTHAWSGTVGVTRTRNPSFGQRGSLYWALGYSGLGVIMATLGGTLVAEAVRGEAGRFNLMAALGDEPWPGGPLARDPLYVAGMLWYALRDRVGLALAGRA